MVDRAPSAAIISTTGSLIQKSRAASLLGAQGAAPDSLSETPKKFKRYVEHEYRNECSGNSRQPKHGKRLVQGPKKLSDAKEGDDVQRGLAARPIEPCRQ